jgi:hypothetical protein
MKNVVKYVRIEGNTVIIVPSKEGRKFLEGRGGLEDGEDTIAGVKVKALIKKFNSGIKNFVHTETLSKNVGSIFVYTDTGELSLGYACMVDEEVEAPKQNDAK